MIKKYFIVINLLISIIVSLCLDEIHAQNTKWNLVLEEQDLRVYTRKIETSHVKEVKIVGTMTANLDTIKKILTDVEKYPEWIYKCVKSERLNIIDAANYHYYIETDFPFPFDSRDVVIKTKNWSDKMGVWYTVSFADSEALPEKKNIVRLSKYSSKWIIKEINYNRVEYEYFFHAEPAGHVPSWVINLGAEKGPMRTIVTLEKRSREFMGL